MMKLDEALKWVADIFEEPEEKIRPQTNRDDIKGWDSLGTLTLMARLDEEFGIILPEEKLTEMNSVQDILNILKDNNCLE